jgi:predicted transcriptional regulator
MTTKGNAEWNEARTAIINFLRSRQGTPIQQDEIAETMGFRDKALVDSVLMELIGQGLARQNHIPLPTRLVWGLEITDRGLQVLNAMAKHSPPKMV